jgi:hypothetical protein
MDSHPSTSWSAKWLWEGMHRLSKPHSVTLVHGLVTHCWQGGGRVTMASIGSTVFRRCMLACSLL